MKKTMGLFVAALVAGVMGQSAFGLDTASAQDKYPARPVKLIIPFAVGGTTDVVGRVVSAKMSELLGQQVVVENRGGAGGMLGTEAAAKSAPDGYTMLMATISTHAINPHLYKNPPVNVLTDFEVVSHLVNVPNVIEVNPNVPAKDLKELLALLRKDPGKLSYGTPGNGSIGHLQGEWFKSQTSTNIEHIPYKGAGPALQDLLAGHINIMFDNLPSSIGHIRDGRLRALAVTVPARVPALPNVPTTAEAGLPEHVAYTWNILMMPAKTPRAIVERMSEVAMKTVNDPQVKSKLEDLSCTVVGTGPADSARFVKGEFDKWGPIVKSSGATVE